MALTQITSQVISSNVITADLVASNAIVGRHLEHGIITAEHFAANVVSEGPIAANINVVQSNVVATQTNVNTVSANAGSINANVIAYAARANANIDIVSQNVTNITNTTDDLNIDDGTFFIDKSSDGIGINNTSPIESSITIGSPANIIFNYGAVGANVLIGTTIATTGFTFDLRGTANTGAITATSVSSAGVELRANDYATYLTAKGGIDGANTAISNEIAATNTDITNLVTGLEGANTALSNEIAATNTDITNLVTGLGGANTNISGNDTDITNLVTGLEGANTAIDAIVDGSTAFTGAVTMNDDLTVQGNLTVAGSFANLAVQDSYTDDRLLYLANNFTGSPSLDVGLLLNRGNDGNVFIGYDESQEEVALLHNFDPATNTAISASAAANLRLNTGYFDAGSAGAPSITFDSDPNTGIYRSAAETITFTTSGTDRFSITTTSMGSPTTGGIRLLSANGTEAAPAFNFSGDTDTGMYRTGTDGLGFSTGGTAALTIADDQDASFASNVEIADGQYIGVGNDQDLQIYHDGSSSYIKNTTGNLTIQDDDGTLVLQAKSGENSFIARADGAVELYFDNAKKLDTKTDGVDITGELQSDSLDVDGNGDISGTLTLGSHLIMGDSDEIQLGTDTDFKIYHDGTDSTVYNFTGDLHIRNTATDKDVAIASDDGSGGLANYFLADGSTTAALLYFGGSAKLTTKTDGVDITGELQSDSLDVDGGGDVSGTLTAGSVTSTGDVIITTGELTFTNAGTGTTAETQIYKNATHGLVLSGQGSTNDILIVNDTGASVLSVPTGTTGAAFAGAVTAASVTSDGVELRANDYITYTQLNANLNAVSSNADAKVEKAGDSMTGALAMGTNKITGLGDPTTSQDAATKTYVDGLLGASIVPAYLVNTSSGTSNVIAMSSSPGNINQIQVTLNGIMQAPYQSSGDMAGDNDWVFNSGNNSIQYTVASLPSGLVTVISAWDTP
jgi:hypothetical protein